MSLALSLKLYNHGDPRSIGLDQAKFYNEKFGKNFAQKTSLNIFMHQEVTIGQPDFFNVSTKQ